MDRLQPHAENVAAYLHDVFIHSDTWQQHVHLVAAVLESLRWAWLTAKEVCDWTKGVTVSGAPLGWRLGASTGGEHRPKGRFRSGPVDQDNKACYGEPLLHTPNFILPFALQIQTLIKGLGAV